MDTPKHHKLPQDRHALTKAMVIHTDKELVKIYVTLGFYPDGRIGEIFIRQGKEGSTIGALLDAVATVTSLALQHGVPWTKIADKLSYQKFPPHGMTEDRDMDLKFVSSPLDYVFRWVNKRLKKMKKEKEDGLPGTRK